MVLELCKHIWSKLFKDKTAISWENDYYLQAARNEHDVREAFLWTGQLKCLPALKRFMQHASYSVNGHDRTLTIHGYAKVTIKPYTYIWRDSDGFDTGKLSDLCSNWLIFRRSELTLPKENTYVPMD